MTGVQTCALPICIEEQKKYIAMLEKENEELRESLAATQIKFEDIYSNVVATQKDNSFNRTLDGDYKNGLFEGLVKEDMFKKECEKIYELQEYVKKLQKEMHNDV